MALLHQYGKVIHHYYKYVLQVVNSTKEGNVIESCGVHYYYLARSTFFSLQTTSLAVFFLSDNELLSLTDALSVGGPVLTTRPICAHLVALRMLDNASSLVASAFPV